MGLEAVGWGPARYMYIYINKKIFMHFQMVHESSLLATCPCLSCAYRSYLKVLLSSSVGLCPKRKCSI